MTAPFARALLGWKPSSKNKLGWPDREARPGDSRMRQDQGTVEGMKAFAQDHANADVRFQPSRLPETVW